MKLHEKIRFIRQLKGWSQEEVANQLEMSVNGYGSIERGETDVKLSRLEQIAHVFGMELLELFDLNEKNVFNLIGDHTQFHHSLISSSSIEPTDFKHELEKANLINEQLQKEITYLKEEITYLREMIKSK
ncbi:transcription factor, MBF1 [Thioploca ingrica]|uniref:Transcription factor, MBF1 n=1 Tax=Thioploca ingrica TaxID=40754 RepID=A0A090ANF4_9GAMM|nr:transcription factor, MBF1 [Thioploca ingrica]